MGFRFHPSRCDDVIRRVIVVLCALASVLGGCSGDATDPFDVVVESEDVLLEAVDRVELRIRPEIPSRFPESAMREFEDGRVETFVSSNGEFVLRADDAWFLDHRVDSAREFAVEVPLIGSAQDDEEIGEPTLIASFLQGDDVIASGGGALAWPLPEGGRINVVVRCDRPAFTRECTILDAASKTAGERAP